MDRPSNDQERIAAGIAHLRGLDLAGLRACWRSSMGRVAPPHLPKHLLFRILAYRLQAEQLGDLDRDTVRLLDDALKSKPTVGDGPAAASVKSVGVRRTLRPGTLLMREWQGAPQRVMVLADGFAWREKVYRSLSEVACAITGSRWNGPRFFGLREKREAGDKEGRA